LEAKESVGKDEDEAYELERGEGGKSRGREGGREEGRQSQRQVQVWLREQLPPYTPPPRLRIVFRRRIAIIQGKRKYLQRKSR
jgi:hypothetical protein